MSLESETILFVASRQRFDDKRKSCKGAFYETLEEDLSLRHFIAIVAFYGYF